MRKKLIHDCERIARAEIEKHESPFMHWCFIIQSRKILAWSKNKRTQTPLKHLGYDINYQFAHAEPLAIKKAWGLINNKKPFSAVNIRIRREDKLLAESKPCVVCFPLLLASGCSEVIWSTDDQTYERYLHVNYSSH